MDIGKLNLNISGFEGPLDLLLELSKNQKVDITKLSILELADQYLDFIKLNINRLNLSADYLVMASFLALLKSRLLLPKDETEELESLEEDITKRLLHYNAIKIASEKIQCLYQEGKDFFTRKQKNNDFFVSNKIVINASLHDLLKTYLSIEKTRKKLNLHIQKDQLFSAEDAKLWLKYFLVNLNDQWSELFDFLPNSLRNYKLKKSAIASILMAALIYAQKGQLQIIQDNEQRKILIKAKKKMDNLVAKKFVEALIFSSLEPLTLSYIKKVISNYGDFDVNKIIREIEFDYKDRGINLFSSENKWFFRTSPLLNNYLKIETEKKRKLSKSTMETLAIISYHQPVTRAEIEKIRGKPVFKGTIDILLDLKWIKPNGRRETPGRPMTWGTDDEFLKHFGLRNLNDLPKVEELESIGLDIK